MDTYLDQLEARCAELGVNLEEICLRDGVAYTTLWRWRKGHTTPRQDTVQALFKRMARMKPRGSRAA
ncbi:MAG TPA: XRE family transcriptional regulator [Marinobacter sp.]|uniref:HTH cro/C1-type domain-containing protein n=1 Tax=marine sediment metagenome TaxID=412755 RepID=A0A0F9P0F0_9ZZZZ|nr:XRE family transcriptional regulator [Marinobacter sp.]